MMISNVKCVFWIYIEILPYVSTILRHLLETMSKISMPLLIHGEETHKNTDIFDREKLFLENNKNVKLCGPEPLILEIIDKDEGV